MTWNLLELFKGTGSVGKVAKRNDFNIVSLDLEKKYKPSILTDILNWDYETFYKTTGFIPNFIWASPPCNTFSPLAYPLKERNPKTATPYSERAKIGTKVLYKTLEIIQYFLSINPNLLFVIENPKGMMRNDKYMKKLNRETTLYSLYGDIKNKPTDFWNNFPDGLNLKSPEELTPQIKKKLVNVVDLKLNDRYSIPSKLIKHIIQEFKKQY